MSKEEYSLDELARLLMSPRSEIRRLLDSGRLPWHPDPATGEPRVAHDRLEAFLAANNMPITTAQYKEREQEFTSLLADSERIEQELTELPAEVRAQVALMFEKLRDEPDPMAAMMDRLLEEPDPEEPADG